MFVRAKKTEPSIALQRASPEPLYQQLARQFETAIREGHLQPGSQIESEDALTKRYKVSRITIRQAIDDLVRKQLLVRKQGKGTFVIGPTVRHDLRRLHGLLGSLFSQSEKASARLLRYELAKPPAEAAKAMSLKPAQTALAVDRLYMIGDKPIALAKGWLAPVVAGISRTKAELISTEDMMHEAGIPVATSQVSIRAEAVGTGIGKLLRVSARTPVLVLQRTSFGRDGAANEFGLIYFRSDSYEIVLSTRHANRAGSLFDIQEATGAQRD
jgi:GntR family transcriptional regulator